MHEKVDFDSLEMKAKAAVVAVVLAAGPWVIVVFGGVVSRVLVRRLLLWAIAEKPCRFGETSSIESRLPVLSRWICTTHLIHKPAHEHPQ